MSELRLHTNKSVNTDTAKYYTDILFNWDDHAPFMSASLQSMMQVFYIELDGFVGAYWDDNKSKVCTRSNEFGSLAQFLYDKKRIIRKRKATDRFEDLLKGYQSELKMIHDARHVLAHFARLDARNKSFIPGDLKIREILNLLAEVLNLLGYFKLNSPNYIERDGRAVESVQRVIDKVTSVNPKSKSMRIKYNLEREKWYKFTKS